MFDGSDKVFDGSDKVFDGSDKRFEFSVRRIVGSEEMIDAIVIRTCLGRGKKGRTSKFSRVLSEIRCFSQF